MLGKKNKQKEVKDEKAQEIEKLEPPKMPEEKPQPETKTEFMIPEMMIIDDLRIFHQNWAAYSDAILKELQHIHKILEEIKNAN